MVSFLIAHDSGFFRTSFFSIRKRKRLNTLKKDWQSETINLNTSPGGIQV